MPRTRLSSYLRTERLRSGLSQREIGELIGLSRSVITKAESGSPLSVRFAIGSAILFDRPTQELFPLIYEACALELLLRAVELEVGLQDRTDAVSLRKRAYLSALINRLQFKQTIL